MLHISLIKLLNHTPVIITLKLNNIFLPILLQDKYNIGVLPVNIECMWFGTKRVERLAKARSFPRFYALPHKSNIYRQCTNIVYIYIYDSQVESTTMSASFH